MNHKSHDAISINYLEKNKISLTTDFDVLIFHGSCHKRIFSYSFVFFFDKLDHTIHIGNSDKKYCFVYLVHNALESLLSKFHSPICISGNQSHSDFQT